MRSWLYRDVIVMNADEWIYGRVIDLVCSNGDTVAVIQDNNDEFRYALTTDLVDEAEYADEMQDHMLERQELEDFEQADEYFGGYCDEML